MYVPGKLVDPNNVIIDIGTRYYAEKVKLFNIKICDNTTTKFQDLKSAKDYFQRKIKFVTEQMEKIQLLGLEKSRIRDTIVEILELKLKQTIDH